MSVLIKRSAGAVNRQECDYGCCTPVHGSNVKHVRRTVKRREKQKLQRDLVRNEM